MVGKLFLNCLSKYKCKMGDDLTYNFEYHGYRLF